ncbi:MAG: hypothetical protein IJ218_01815 [Alphaproteobacteria bacterium]|nr:hypothetical protein [Alphaproteobacteria bacterium]
MQNPDSNELTKAYHAGELKAGWYHIYCGAHHICKWTYPTAAEIKQREAAGLPKPQPKFTGDGVFIGTNLNTLTVLSPVPSYHQLMKIMEKENAA